MRPEHGAPAIPNALSHLVRFYRRAERQRGRIERYYQIAGRTVCLRFAGPALVAKLTPAFAHLETTTTASPDLVICVADAQSSGVALPALDWTPGIYYTPRGAHYLHLHEDSAGDFLGQEAFLPRFGLAVLALADATAYPPYAQAAPLRNILIWWLAQQGCYGLHTAAVGDGAGVALIIGAGGAGKSTTAIACLQAGLTYLGDDFCVLDLDPTPRIHSLYSTGKLCEDSRHWLKPDTSTTSGLRDAGKMIYQWYPQFAAQLPATMPIRALLLPSVSGAVATNIRPVPPAAAFTALATTTLRVTSLPTRSCQQLLRAIRQLVQTIPCYQLALGSATSQIPTTILHVLEQSKR